MSSNVITVIDLGLGNVSSVCGALKKLKIGHELAVTPEQVLKAEKLIFPGVGNFAEASRRLGATGIGDALRGRVAGEGIPILGICLGMQLFASTGDEGGGAPGLDFVKGRVSFHRGSRHSLRLPHIGWNDVTHGDFPLFDGIPEHACFYFVHSYELITGEIEHKAVSSYGEEFIAAIHVRNIWGVQFHPEKSQGWGLRLLENFCMRCS